MIIKEINITDYGPLRNITISPERFDCLFGLNESGKTALVETLAYCIFRKSTSALRYEKPGQIRVTVEHNRKTYTLPGKKLPPRLAPGDIAALHYICASDSSLYSASREDRFWDTLKTMFTNIHGDITFAKIDTKIFESLELQPVRAEWEKQKQQRISAEQQRAEELYQYIRQRDDIIRKETELKKALQKKGLLATEIEKIETFHKYRSYQEVRDLHNTYREEKSKLQDYERYKYEYQGEWEKLIIEREAHKRDERKLEEVKQKIVAIERDLMEINRKEEFINVEGLRTQDNRSQEDKFQIHLTIPLTVLLIATIFAVVSFFTPLSELFFLGLWLASAGFLLYTLRHRHLKRKSIAQRKEWFRRARQVFPDITSVQDLHQRIEEHGKKKVKTETLLHAMKAQEEELKGAETIAKIDSSLATMHRKTGLAEIDDLKAKLAEKRTIEDRIHTLHIKIKNILGDSDEAKWDRLIQDRKTTKPSSKPDADMLSELQLQHESVQHEINTLQNEITVFHEVMQARFNIHDDCSVFVEYSDLQQRLRNYEIEQEAALTARSILQDMSNELDEYISNMLEGDQSLGEYFQHITGRYTEVAVENETFVVRDKMGNSYTVDQLSSGAKDQLLFCFRLIALRKLYPEGCFLILDDAFIFADWERRRALAVLLEKFIEDGNQVLYLTSDDHTRDLLKDNGARVINL